MLKQLSWLLARWSVMHHPREEVYRIKQFFQTKFFDVVQAQRNSFKKSLSFHGSGQEYPAIRYADYPDILELPVYQCSVRLSNIIDWRTDVKAEISSGIEFTGRISTQDFSVAGDYRYVSQLNRLHHFPYLALVNDETNEALSLLSKHVISWCEQNPYLKSINWKSGIEVGIRAVNLAFTEDILAGKNDSESKSILSLIELWQQKNLQYLLTHLSLFSSANNHLLYELLGITVISLTHNYPDSEDHFNQFSKELERQFDEQVYTDGFSKEQSVHYHAEVANIFITYVALLKKYGENVNADFCTKLLGMGKALQKFMVNDRMPWHIGDSDEGEILYPYFQPEYNLYRSIFYDSQVLGGGGIAQANSPDLRNQLLWGAETPVFQRNKNDNTDGVSVLRDSGYLVIRDKRINLIFDFGPLGFGALAAHGHSDLLQVLLAIDGVPVLVDPGTYQYHSRFASLRNYFRGASSHNTITVKGFDQGRSGGRMLWTKVPEVTLHGYSDAHDKVFLSASHNGFKKQGIELTHKRTLCYNKNEGAISIEDQLLASTGPLPIEFNLHFHPEVSLTHNGDFLTASIRDNVVTITNPLFINGDLFEGNMNHPYSGLASEKFDVLRNCKTFKLELQVSESISLHTQVSIEE